MIAWLGTVLSKLPLLGSIFDKLATTSSKAEELKAEAELEEAKALSKKGWVSPRQLAKYCIVIMAVIYAVLYMLDCVWDFADLPTFEDMLNMVTSALSVLGG